MTEHNAFSLGVSGERSPRSKIPAAAGNDRTWGRRDLTHLTSRMERQGYLQRSLPRCGLGTMTAPVM